MALSRERIADELLKLLALPDPSATVGIMLDRGILKPVLPEIAAERLAGLRDLIGAERAAKISADPLRRLAVLLPRDPETAGGVAVRLKLSNNVRKRLACAAGNDLDSTSEVVAYRRGTECAVDRLLLAGHAGEAARIAKWHPPRLPISGGALIERGLAEGPIVARTLRKIEERWLDAGFPGSTEFETIVADALEEAQR